MLSIQSKLIKHAKTQSTNPEGNKTQITDKETTSDSGIRVSRKRGLTMINIFRNIIRRWENS